MKKILMKLRNFKMKYLTNKRHVSLKYAIREAFYMFFEGEEIYGYDEDYEGYPFAVSTIEPIIDIPVRKFGITEVKYKFKKDMIILYITLKSPGIFIGRSGNAIKELTKYLSESLNGKQVKIFIYEAKDPFRL